MVDEPPRNQPNRPPSSRDEAWYREFLRREFELIGINANTDSSRERTRSNFSLVDGMNNQATKEAISFLLDLTKERASIEEVIERSKQRRGAGAELRKGLLGSLGEWAGRAAIGAIGTAIGWYLLGKH